VKELKRTDNFSQNYQLPYQELGPPVVFGSLELPYEASAKYECLLFHPSSQNIYLKLLKCVSK
jgi:hypothetical protein